MRGKESFAAAVNTAGYIAGAYSPNQNYSYVAFLMNPQGQISTIFTPPTGSVVTCCGMNNLNQVVGNWTNSQGVHQGFVYTNGTVNSAFNYPGAVATSPNAINDSGEIAGSWTDSVGFVHGFIWTQKLGFTSFDAPKSTYTIPLAINNSGTVVGYFSIKEQGSPYSPFMYAGGAVKVIPIPKAVSAGAAGINSQGLIVGGYTTKTQSRGFLYQP